MMRILHAVSVYGTMYCCIIPRLCVIVRATDGVIPVYSVWEIQGIGCKLWGVSYRDRIYGIVWEI